MMLTAEYSADPRRANWLTLGGSPDDFAWPDTRPASELEAEILRLTTRLMMRERELRQARAQASRAQQQAAAWRQRMEAKEEQVQALLVRKDTEMQGIVSQLLLFEAELRQEQRRIEGLLAEKDARIAKQQEEMACLRAHREEWNGYSPDLELRWKTNPSSQFPEKDFRKTPDSRKDIADRDSSWRTKDFVSDSWNGSAPNPALGWETNSSSQLPERDFRNTPDSRKDIADRDSSSWRTKDFVSDSRNGSAPNSALGWETNPSSQFPEKDFCKTRKNTADKNSSSWRTKDFVSDSWNGTQPRNSPEEQFLNTKEDIADIDNFSMMLEDSFPRSLCVNYHGVDDSKVNPSSHTHENDFRTPSPRKGSSESDYSIKSGMEDSIPDLIQVAYIGVGDGEKNPSRHSPGRDSRKMPDLRKETSDKDRHSLRIQDSTPESVLAGYHAINSWKTRPPSRSLEIDSSKMQVSGKDCVDSDHSSWIVKDSAPDSVNMSYYDMDSSTRKMGQGSHSLEKESRKTQDHRGDVADRSHSSRIIEDFAEIPAVDAVRKLKDGLTKIRAIQDVTNVASLGSSCDIPPVEKKKVPSRQPQKMKDLKAKRTNHHKVHRSVVNEICGQAIL